MDIEIAKDQPENLEDIPHKVSTWLPHNIMYIARLLDTDFCKLVVLSSNANQRSDNKINNVVAV